jgi:hypothetical protein
VITAATSEAPERSSRITYPMSAKKAHWCFCPAGPALTSRDTDLTSRSATAGRTRRLRPGGVAHSRVGPKSANLPQTNKGRRPMKVILNRAMAILTGRPLRYSLYLPRLCCFRQPPFMLRACRPTADGGGSTQVRPNGVGSARVRGRAAAVACWRNNISAAFFSHTALALSQHRLPTFSEPRKPVKNRVP